MPGAQMYAEPSHKYVELEVKETGIEHEENTNLRNNEPPDDESEFLSEFPAQTETCEEVYKDQLTSDRNQTDTVTSGPWPQQNNLTLIAQYQKPSLVLIIPDGWKPWRGRLSLSVKMKSGHW